MWRFFFAPRWPRQPSPVYRWNGDFPPSSVSHCPSFWAGFTSAQPPNMNIALMAKPFTARTSTSDTRSQAHLDGYWCGLCRDHYYQCPRATPQPNYPGLLCRVAPGTALDERLGDCRRISIGGQFFRGRRVDYGL